MVCKKQNLPENSDEQGMKSVEYKVMNRRVKKMVHINKRDVNEDLVEN